MPAAIFLTLCVFSIQSPAESITDNWGSLHDKLDDTLALLAEKQKLEKHVNSYRIDPAVLRDFLTAGVRACSPAA